MPFAPLVFVALLFVLAGWSPSDPALADLYAAIVSGRYGWLAGLGLIFLVEPAKRWMLARVKPTSWLSTNLGGLALVFVFATISGLGHALIAGVEWTPALPIAIVRNAAIAIGGYTAIKKALLERWPALAGVVGASMPRPTLPPPSSDTSTP